MQLTRQSTDLKYARNFSPIKPRRKRQKAIGSVSRSQKFPIQTQKKIIDKRLSVNSNNNKTPKIYEIGETLQVSFQHVTPNNQQNGQDLPIQDKFNICRKKNKNLKKQNEKLFKNILSLKSPNNTRQDLQSNSDSKGSLFNLKFPLPQQTTTISDVQIEECPYENENNGQEQQRIPDKESLSKEDFVSFGPLLQSSPERKGKNGQCLKKLSDRIQERKQELIDQQKRYESPDFKSKLGYFQNQDKKSQTPVNQFINKKQEQKTPIKRQLSCQDSQKSLQNSVRIVGHMPTVALPSSDDEIEGELSFDDELEPQTDTRPIKEYISQERQPRSQQIRNRFQSEQTAKGTDQLLKQIEDLQKDYKLSVQYAKELMAQILSKDMQINQLESHLSQAYEVIEDQQERITSLNTQNNSLTNLYRKQMETIQYFIEKNKEQVLPLMVKESPPQEKTSNVQDSQDHSVSVSAVNIGVNQLVSDMNDIKEQFNKIGMMNYNLNSLVEKPTKPLSLARTNSSIIRFDATNPANIQQESCENQNSVYFKKEKQLYKTKQIHPFQEYNKGMNFSRGKTKARWSPKNDFLRKQIGSLSQKNLLNFHPVDKGDNDCPLSEKSTDQSYLTGCLMLGIQK